MPDPDIRVVGAERFGVVARKLKDVGDKDLRKELLKGLQEAAKPLKVAVANSARAKLPKRGGLAEFVASGKVTVNTRAGANPGITIKSQRGSGADKGTVRHPVFGSEVWVGQPVSPGWFTQTLTDAAPAVREELVKVIDDVAKKVT
jgi:hypothetical protein